MLNYAVSGAPVAAFKVELSAEYFNVEFTGKDIRNWQKTEGGYLVQLHTPVAGAYTLLATYERPFKAQGETLTFTGARPLMRKRNKAIRWSLARINLGSGRSMFPRDCFRWKPARCRRIPVVF